MISCTQFIAAYSELFSFLEKIGGPEAVDAYWEHLASFGIKGLEDLAREKGLRGCYEYWSHTLNEEAADFTMTLDEEAGTFTIEMEHCPSKGRLLQLNQMVPYHRYCGHCNILYRRILEPLGFQYDYDMNGCEEARCKLTVTDLKRAKTDRPE